MNTQPARYKLWIMVLNCGLWWMKKAKTGKRKFINRITNNL